MPLDLVSLPGPETTVFTGQMEYYIAPCGSPLLFGFKVVGQLCSLVGTD